MQIVVCIKQVFKLLNRFSSHITGFNFDPDAMIRMLNPYDEIAVEASVRIKESFDECEVVGITVGPSSCDQILRYSFAMGIDRMIRIDVDTFDPWVTSLALAFVIKQFNCDVILCGKKAIDNNAGQVGSFLAEFLELPQVSSIVDLTILLEEKKAIVERDMGSGDRQLVECELPALFTVEYGLNDPRYPKLEKRLLSEIEEIEVIKIPSDIVEQFQKMDFTHTMIFSHPKPQKFFIPDCNLSAKERMKLIMTGGITKKKTEFLEGDADELTQKIIKFLNDEGII